MVCCSFTALTAFLREKKVICGTKACLQRVHLLCSFRHGSQARGLVNVRVFLASYMIVHFSSNVFETMGELEQRVFDAAVALLEAFERICGAISRSFQDVPEAMSRVFQPVLFEYIEHFNAWKAFDEKKLTVRIEVALRALYSLPDSPEVRTQTGRLREKLLQVGGVSAVRKVDLDRIKVARMDVPYYSNEQLAHELLLDPDFKLERLFYNAPMLVADDLRLKQPCFVRVILALRHIRDGIVEVAPASDAMAIAPILDLDVIQQRAVQGDYSWGDCARLISSVAAVMKRGEFQGDFVNPEDDLCRGIEFLLGKVQEMRIDAVNARLRVLAPVLVDNGVEIERQKFLDRVNAGTLTLERTRAWLRGDLVSAMMDLVTAAEPLTSATCPETLLMDVERLCVYQSEFAFVVSAAVAVVHCEHVLGRRDLGMRVAATLMSEPDVAEAMRSVAGVGAFRVQHAMQALMSQRVRFMYEVVLRDGRAPEGALGPLVARAAGKVKKLMLINYAVHAESFRGFAV